VAHDLAKVGAGVRFSLVAPDKCGNKYISLFPTSEYTGVSQIWGASVRARLARGRAGSIPVS
jgi:hypothetical protein